MANLKMEIGSALRGITVEPVLFLYMLAAFMSFGAFQDLLYYKTCYVRYADHNVCSNLTGDVLTYTQTEGSHWMIYCNIALYLPSILVACYVGSWSDRHGRKTPMLIAVFSTLLGYLMYMFSAHYEDSSAAYLVAANFVVGMGGGAMGLLASVMSYVADITFVETRTTRVSILESMTFLGMAVGPVLSGYIMVGSSRVYVFLFCLVCNAILEIYIVVRIENTKPVSGHDTFPVSDHETQHINRTMTVANDFNKLGCNFGHIYAGLVTCFKDRDGRKRIYILVTIVAFICVIMASAGENNLIYLYVKDVPLSWDYLTYSQYQSVHTGLGAVLLLFGLPLLRRYFQLEDTTLIFMGLASRAAGLTLLALSTTTAMIFCVPVVALFAIFPSPCLRSFLSKQVDGTEQGKLFSLLATVENIFQILGSALFNYLYPVTRPVLRGFCFFVGTGFVACAFMLTSFIFIDRRRLRLTHSA